MAIKEYFVKGKKCYEVYVGGFDSAGRRWQRRKCKIESRIKAEKIEFEFKRELAQRREADVMPRWAEWLDECVRRMKLNMQPRTVEGYEGQLAKWVTPNWGALELDKITKAQVHSLIFEHMAGCGSPYTPRKVYKMTARVFQMAVEEGILARNPCVGIRLRVPEAEQKVLSNPEVEIFLKEAQTVRHRFFPVWFIALKTGMRSGELLALTWSDIDFDTKTIKVARQWTSKTGFTTTKTQKTRVVPISEDLLRFLKARKIKERSQSDFVLPHLEEWLRGEQAKVTREFCLSIGITPIKFHDLRATFITNLLARGVSLAQVMSVVGHSQLKTTNGYLRKAGVEVQGVTDQLGYQLPDEVAEGKIYFINRDQK